MNSDASAVTERVAPAESATEAVVLAIAEATNRDPLDLDPLYDSVDPDVLDRLVQSPDGERSRSTVEFAHAGCDVTVRADGRVAVKPPASSPSVATSTSD